VVRLDSAAVSPCKLRGNGLEFLCVPNIRNKRRRVKTLAERPVTANSRVWFTLGAPCWTHPKGDSADEYLLTGNDGNKTAK
jgi:hypothetical protein